MYVFLDTNVLLSFYHFASDDLDELQKLIAAIQSGSVVLVIPDQVRDEFSRNREAKIADALSRLREQRLNLQFPQICKDSQLYPHLRDAQRSFEKYHGLLVKEITDAAGRGDLKADALIDQLFAVGKYCQTDNVTLTSAQLRLTLGNPPGKNGSLGDAINWETLLRQVPSGQDLYFISDDKDFRSPVNDARMSQYLTEEWERKKRSTVHYYTRISAFLADYYPNIKLATEREIECLIADLANSGTFVATHAIVAKFAKYSEFTEDQARRIVAAAVENSQVSWILTDDDVAEFVKRVIAGREAAIEPENLASVRAELSEPDTTDDIPF